MIILERKQLKLNINLQVTMIGTSEAMNLGISLGLEPKLLAGIMSSATGRCWPVITERRRL